MITGTEHSFFQLMVVCGAAALVATFFHFLRLPTLAGFIVAGFLLGPGGFGVIGSLADAQMITEFGTILLMFTIGLELPFHKLKLMRRSLLFLGPMQVGLTILVAFLICMYGLSLPVYQSLFISLILAPSSTAVVLRALQDAREIETHHGNTIVGVLLFQDMCVIPIMLAVPLLAPGATGDMALSLAAFAWFALKLLMAAVFLVVASRFGVPFILRHVVQTRSRELFFFCVLFLVLGIAYIAELSGFSMSFGAFVAGVIISDSPYGRQATSEVVPLRDNLIGLFFISVGLLIDSQFLATHGLTIIALAAGILAAKAAVIYAAGRVYRYNFSVAVLAALALSQIGEFSLIVAELGMSANIITANQFQFILCLTALTMSATPFLMRLSPKVAFSDRLRSLGDKIKLPSLGISNRAPLTASIMRPLQQPKPHSIIVGYGAAGKNLGEALDGLGIPFEVIDINYNPTKKQEKNVRFHYGDASRHEVLEHAGIMHAKLVVISVSGTQMSQAVVNAIRWLRPDIPIILRVQYLRDAEIIQQTGPIDVIVAELETSLEILSRALGAYGVGSQQVHELLVSARKEFSTSHRGIQDSLRRSMELPSWEALSAIRPLRVEDESYAVGKSLADLNIRRLSGASIVSVYRDGMGTTIPKADFTIMAGDLLQVIGHPDAFQMASTLIKSGDMGS